MTHEIKSVEGRKAYHTPRLEEYGEVRELTQASEYSVSWNADGGTYPTSYSSST